jgi:DnaJ-class molecular chaperone
MTETRIKTGRYYTEVTLKLPQRCRRCNGTGRLHRGSVLTRNGRPFQTDASDFPVYSAKWTEPCPCCHGTGRVETETC